MNNELSDQLFFLYKSTVTAVYEPVELKDWIRLLFKHKCNVWWNPYQQLFKFEWDTIRKLEIITVLHKIQFSKSSHDLGCSSLVEHTIKS